MIAVLQGLPIEPLTPEREQALFLAGDTESVVLHALAPAFQYAQNVHRGKVKISQAEILSLCWAALSKSIKTFKPGMKSFLSYSKPFLRGEIFKFYRDKNVVRDAFKHETQVETEFPKPLESESVEPAWEAIQMREQWAKIQPLIGKSLSALEIRVLDFRFKQCLTLQETGEHIGKSRERARQIEAKALQKLRAALPKGMETSYENY